MVRIQKAYRLIFGVKYGLVDRFQVDRFLITKFSKDITT